MRIQPAVHQPRRGDLVVRHADEGMTEDKDPFDMSAIGLDDIMQLTDDAEMSSRVRTSTLKLIVFKLIF